MKLKKAFETKGSRIHLFIFMLLLLPQILVLGQTEFYVAPNGLDTNTGTPDHPFQTLAKAKEAVAKQIPSMTGDITVYFKGGDYFFTDGVEFTPADAGVNNHRIIYQAYEDEKPVFNGATKVTGWEKFNENIYKAHLDHTAKLRSLIVNGTRAFMASKEVSAKGEWGTYEIVAGEAQWAWASGSAPDGIKYSTSDVPVLSNPDDVEIWKSTTWNTHIVCARDIITDGGSRVLKLQQPSAAIAFHQKWGGFSASGSHTIHNAFEFLDEPGEFYFNRKTNTLYYYPRSGEDLATAEVYAPRIGKLISIQGNSKTERVSHLIFQGITFAYTESILPKVGDSEGKSTVQAATWCVAFDDNNWHATAYRAYDAAPNSVSVSNAQNIQFKDNTFKHIGNEGIGFINDASDCKFVGNLCYDIGGGAVQVGHPQHVYEGDDQEYAKYSPEEEGVCRNVLVENNVLYDMTTMFYGHAPITAYFVDSLQLVKNHIQKCNYSAVSVGWGWYDFDEESKPGNPTTTCRNNVISYNRVYDCMKMLHDGGAFYTLGSQPNSTSDGNYVKAATSHFQGVYHPDEGTAWYTGKDMVFEIARGQDNFELNDWRRKHDNHYSNIYSTSGSMQLGAPNCTVTDLHVVPYANWPEEALAIIRAAGVDPNYHQLLDVIPDIIFRDDKRYDTKGLIVDTIPPPAGSRIEAENYSSANGTKIENCSDTDGGQDVGTIKNGNWLMFSSIDLNGMQSVDMRLASELSGGSIEIHLGSSTGTLIGTLEMPNTGGWQTWKTVSLPIKDTEGIHDVYLVFKTSASYVGNINWLQFSVDKFKFSEAIITSNVYTIDQTRRTISNIPNGIRVNAFVDNLELSLGATVKIYQPDGKTEATELGEGCRVIVTAEDGITSKRYKVVIITSIETVQKQDLFIYPNPSYGYLIIENDANSKVEIFNTKGQKVFEALMLSPSFSISTTGLKAGTYIIKIKYKESLKSGTFLKL